MAKKPAHLHAADFGAFAKFMQKATLPTTPKLKAPDLYELYACDPQVNWWSYVRSMPVGTPTHSQWVAFLNAASGRLRAALTDRLGDAFVMYPLGIVATLEIAIADAANRWMLDCVELLFAWGIREVEYDYASQWWRAKVRLHIILGERAVVVAGQAQPEGLSARASEQLAKLLAELNHTTCGVRLSGLTTVYTPFGVVCEGTLTLTMEVMQNISVTPNTLLDWNANPFVK